jgi:hypothetical protein
MHDRMHDLFLIKPGSSQAFECSLTARRANALNRRIRSCRFETNGAHEPKDLTDDLRVGIKAAKMVTFWACELEGAVVSNTFAAKDLVIDQHGQS